MKTVLRLTVLIAAAVVVAAVLYVLGQSRWVTQNLVVGIFQREVEAREGLVRAVFELEEGSGSVSDSPRGERSTFQKGRAFAEGMRARDQIRIDVFTLFGFVRMLVPIALLILFVSGLRWIFRRLKRPPVQTVHTG